MQNVGHQITKCWQEEWKKQSSINNHLLEKNMDFRELYVYKLPHLNKAIGVQWIYSYIWNKLFYSVWYVILNKDIEDEWINYRDSTINLIITGNWSSDDNQQKN